MTACSEILMTDKTDVLIIGGGISGLLTARELRLAGCEVTIVDRQQPGQESSWAGGGILLPIYPWRQPVAISDLVIPSVQQYPHLQAELLAATGIDPEWRPCGMWISHNPDIEQALEWCQQRDVSHQTVIPAGVLPTTLNSTRLHPLWLPDIAQIRNPRLLKSLLAYLQQLGVQFVADAILGDIEIEQQRIKSILVSGRRWQFQHLVVTAGAWTADVLTRLVPGFVPHFPVKPIKGQMLLFAAEPQTLKCMVLEGDHYLIPRADGKILAGSTVENVGFDKTTTSAAREALYHFAIQLLPDLKTCKVEQHWAGLRPGSPDGVPTIGLHPQLTNLAINVGHFRNGLVMGPASAQLLADLLLQRPASINPAAYAWRT